MRKIIIAVDGYSSCGKSTFARRIAAEYGYVFIDTGAMYRAVTLFALHQGYFRSDGSIDKDSLTKALPELEIYFKFNEKIGASDIFLNGENVEKQIRSIEVSDKVSIVSSIAEVRGYLVSIQQKIGAEKGVVMDGRDIGTVVFPDAELKIFMTADPDVRAMRRYNELTAKGEEVSLEEVKKNLLKRDSMDENRAVSPLRKAEDALLLDNSNMSVEQQMDWVKEKINALV